MGGDRLGSYRRIENVGDLVVIEVNFESLTDVSGLFQCAPFKAVVYDILGLTDPEAASSVSQTSRSSHTDVRDNISL